MVKTAFGDYEAKRKCQQCQIRFSLTAETTAPFSRRSYHFPISLTKACRDLYLGENGKVQHTAGIFLGATPDDSSSQHDDENAHSAAM